MQNIPEKNESVNTPQQENLVDIYIGNLPDKPYATDALGGLHIYTKEAALEKRYIQHNKPYSVSNIVVDYDKPGGVYASDDLHAPPPSFCTTSPESGNSHLLFQLENKVYSNRPDNLLPYRKLVRVYSRLTAIYGGDPSYAGFISKNPIHEGWISTPQHMHTYDLEELEDWLGITKNIGFQESLFTAGLGRNVTLFHYTRFEAYGIATAAGFNLELDTFIKELFAIALAYNIKMFQYPLDEREVYGIAKSVGKWTFTRFSKKSFAVIQSRRAKKLAGIRTEKANQQYREIKEAKLTYPALSNRALAKLLHIGERTVRRALLYIADTKDDSELFIEKTELFGG